MESGKVSENTIGELQPVVAAETTVVGEKRKSRRAPKRGRVSKKVKLEDEDVCFVCLNGGDLVLCDFKGCPKAYHLGCIKKDEKILSSKVKWICGWHLCTTCLKSAHYTCYTCTISYCKKCVQGAEFVCVRGNNGFCSSCLKLVMMIEVQDAEKKEKMEVDFDDQDSWDYLFKLYWTDVKNKLSLTLNELKEGRNTWNKTVGSDFLPQPSEDEATKTHEHSQREIVHQASLRTESCGEKSTVVDKYADWGSRELLEFVSHIKNGDTTVMSRSNVQLLLFDYINSKNLHDPNQVNQIICDEKLKNLFGKPFVGHMEMLKLLDFHFMMKSGDNQKKAGMHVCADKHKSQTNNLSLAIDEDRTPQTNFDDYAAIDVHNISLIFLRRSMIESILGEVENFHEQVVGSIVRIIVSNDGLKPDMHRLVQVVGTSKGARTYQLGDKTTDIMLEVLNLTRKESIQIDAISDEDFSEDECKRLHQGIKFGIVKRLAVEEIQSKAVGLQALKFHDWLAAEILRLNRIRNQAKAQGLDKEVIECTEKLKMLKTPEERQRRLSSIPEVHSDPKMNPSYESEDEEEDKRDKRTSDEGLHEKENGCVSNTCDNKQVEDNANGMGVSWNQASGSETAIILVSDASVGKYHDVSTDPQKSSELSVDDSDVLDLPSPNAEACTENLEIVPASEEIHVDMEIQAAGSETAIILSDASVGKFNELSTDPQKSSELSVDDSDVLDLPSPNPETGTDIFPPSEEIPVDMEIQLVSDAFGNYHEVSTDRQSPSELSVDDSDVLDLPSPNPETGTENLEVVPASKEIHVDMEIQACGSETAIILVSDASSVGKYHEVSTDRQKLSELGVDDSNVLDLPIPNPEAGTGNLEIVPSCEENPVDMEIQANDTKMSIGKDLMISDAPTNSSENMSSWQAINGCIKLSVDDSNVLDLPSPNPEIGTENLEIVPASEENFVDMAIQANDMKISIGENLTISDGPANSNENMSSWQAVNGCIELSVDDSNVLDLPSPNPETGTENLEIVPASKENHVDMEIQDNDMKMLIGNDLPIFDAPTNSNENMSSWQAMNGCIELSVDDSNVLDLPSPNPEIGTENLGIVPASEENFVDMEIPDNDMKMLIGNDLPIFDAPTDSNQNLSRWPAINECIEFTTLPEESVEDFIAEITAMGGGDGETTTDMIDFEDTGRSDAFSSTEPCLLLEAIMDDIFGKSDGAANNPPPTESSSSHIQK